jgi:hypothetical protein
MRGEVRGGRESPRRAVAGARHERVDRHRAHRRSRLDGDAKTWIAARRERSAEAALDKLVAEHAPLAAKIRAAKQWADVATYARANTRRPDVDDLRIARLLGDPALEARARAVLDDKLAHLALELAVVLDPTSPTEKEDLVYLDRR